MGRANQKIRPINLSGFVQGAMQGNDMIFRGGAAKAAGISKLGEGIGGGLLQRRANQERQKDRNLQVEERRKDRQLQKDMQGRNQRLGWARLQFDRQTSLLNDLDRDLKNAESRLSSMSGMAAFGAQPDEKEMLQAHQDVEAAKSRRAEVRNALYRTQDATGVQPIDAQMDVAGFRAGTDEARFEMGDTYSPGGT
jgi:hypothetical protein